MKTLLVICVVCIVIAIPFGIKSSVAYKKNRIEKKASRFGYDLKFDK